jgi:hypothetical protein
MRSIWSSGHAHGAGLPGPGASRPPFRGFRLRLSSLFTFSERPGACQVRIAAPEACSSSAERMDVNSRGCQPTEQRRNGRSTLRGSNHEHPANTGCITSFVRPFQGRRRIAGHSVGFTHGYSPSSPPVNRDVRQFQNAGSLLVNRCHRLAFWPSRLCVFARAPYYA